MAGLTDISLGNFTTVEYGDQSGSPVAITNIQSITHPTDERTIVEVPQFGQQYKRKLVGSSSTGNAEIVVNFDPSEASHNALLALYTSGAQEDFRFIVNEDATGTNGQYIDFKGRVASKSSSGEFDSITTLTFSIAIDGAIGTWTAKA